MSRFQNQYCLSIPWGQKKKTCTRMFASSEDGAVDGPVATAELLGQCEALSVSGPRAEAVVVTWALVEINAEADSPIVLEPLKVALLRVANAVPVASTDGELETVPHKEAAVEGELLLPLEFGLADELAAPEDEPALLGDATPETLLLPLAEGATLVLALPHSDLVETPLGETPLPLEFGLADALAAPEGEPALLGDPTPETLLLPLAEGATLALALPHSDLVETPLGDSTWVVVGPPELVTVAVEEAEAHKVIELIKLVVKQAEGAPLALLDPDPQLEPVPDTVAVIELLAVVLAVPVRLPVADAVTDFVAVEVREPVVVPDAVVAALNEREAVGLLVPVREPAADAEEVPLPVPVAVLKEDAVTDFVAVEVREPVVVPDAEVVALQERVPVELPVAVWLAVGAPEADAAAEAVHAAVVVAEGDAVREGAGEPVRDAVPLEVAVLEALAVAEPETAPSTLT